MTDSNIYNDPFHEDAPAWAKVQTVLLMRIYDVNMAILANMNQDGRKAANILDKLHSEGGLLGGLPWLAQQDEDTE